MVRGDGFIGVQLRDRVKESLESSLKSLMGSDLKEASVRYKYYKMILALQFSFKLSKKVKYSSLLLYDKTEISKNETFVLLKHKICSGKFK